MSERAMGGIDHDFMKFPAFEDAIRNAESLTAFVSEAVNEAVVFFEVVKCIDDRND